MRKRLLLAFLIATIFFILTTPAYSGDWVHVVKSNNDEYYLDLDNIKIDCSIITFWDNRIFTISKNNMKSRISINCRDGTYNIIAIVDYKSDNTVREKYDFEQSPKWIGILPDSVMGAFQMVLCEGDKPTQDVRGRYRKFFIEELLKSNLAPK